jgi:CRP-like cAMP-binding protein
VKPFIKEIGPELAEKVRARGRERSYAEGEQIFAEGDNASALPIIVFGKVKMVHFLEHGKEVIISIFGTGEMFALPPVIDGKVYPAAAIAMENTRLLLLPRQDLFDLLENSSEFALAVIRWMSAMLRDKTATIQNLSEASPEHRIATVLLKLAKDSGDEIPVRIMLRREDIANIAGLTTETTIRVIRRMAAKGLVRIDHGKIFIENRTRLQRLAGG